MIQITADEFRLVVANLVTAKLQIDLPLLYLNRLLAKKQQPQEQPPKKKVVEWEYRIDSSEDYSYINSRGDVMGINWNDLSVDHYRYKMDNTFGYEREAKAKKKYDLLFADYCELIRQTNEKAGLVLDWGDYSQTKTHIYYSHWSDELEAYMIQTTQQLNDKEYWLIPQKEVLPLLQEYFTDTELKAIATKNHKLLMEGK